MLIPFQSTHFIIPTQDIGGYSLGGITLGKVYEIEKWEGPLAMIFFLDDDGDLRTWVPSPGFQDVSFHVNLEKILE